MSERRKLYALAMAGKYHSPDASEACSTRIDAFKAEVLREAAEKIRDLGHQAEDTTSALGPNYSVVAAVYASANLIDPDKED